MKTINELIRDLDNTMNSFWCKDEDGVTISRSVAQSMLMDRLNRGYRVEPMHYRGTQSVYGYQLFIGNGPAILTVEGRFSLVC